MENIKWICKDCNSSFQSRALLRSHRKICDKKQTFVWECNYCKEKFPSRRKLSEHRKLSGHFGYQNFQILDFCPFCNKRLTTRSTYKTHIKSCIKNPNRVPGYARKWTDEEKKAASDRMKKLHQEGKAFSWADLSKRKEPSYPEKWLMEVLKNEYNLIENQNYEREVKFYTFSLDFVFTDKKVIEIDGSQHKRSEYQKDCDMRKDAKLQSEGWKELRLDWNYCYHNPKEAINLVGEFLGIGAREAEAAALLRQ